MRKRCTTTRLIQDAISEESLKSHTHRIRRSLVIRTQTHTKTRAPNTTGKRGRRPEREQALPVVVQKKGIVRPHQKKEINTTGSHAHTKKRGIKGEELSHGRVQMSITQILNRWMDSLNANPKLHHRSKSRSARL